MVSVPFCLKFTSLVAVYRQAQLKEELPHTQREKIIIKQNEIVRAALNKKKYR